jgi:RimJ/RimL family protein N-acetyltransferase
MINIRYPTINDKKEFLDAMQASRNLHSPWVEAPINENDFLEYIKKYQSDNNISYLICVNKKIAGVININQIIQGCFQSAFLGYYAVNGFAKQGIMIKGLNMAIDKAFNEHGLHRLEANIQPKNIASINLVKRCGFKKEGFSPKYLKIMNKWCDHERWAIVKN